MSKQSVMQVGFHSVGLHKYQVETVIEKVAAAGYDAVELSAETMPWAQPHVTPSLSKAQRSRLRKQAQAAGLVVSAIGAHVCMVDADSVKRKANVEYAIACIGLASDLGAPVAHLLSGDAPAGVPRQEAMKWLVEGVARCIKQGDSLGVRIGFEPVANQLVHNTATLQEVMAVLESQELYVNLDPSHLHVHGDDVALAVRLFADRLAHVHVKDARGKPESLQFPPLGMGDVDFPNFVGALKEVGYNGVLSVEYEANAFGYRNTEEEILDGSLRFVRGILD
jgi:sugar phosphate isomerase/epimerase